MLQPGRDDNYPSTSGNIARGLSATQFSLNGFHLTLGSMAIIVLLLLVWNLARRRRR